MDENLQHIRNQSNLNINKQTFNETFVQRTQSSSSSQLPSSNPPTQQLLNIWLLIQKNIILTIKNPKNLIFLIIAPFLLSGFLAFFQHLANQVAGESWINNPIQPVATLPKCFGKGCTSLSYMTIISNDTDDPSPPWIKHTVEYIRRFGEPGIAQTMVEKPYVTSVDDWAKVRQELTDNPNSTQIGLVFCLDSSQLLTQFFCFSTENVRSYYLFLNKTDSFGTIFAPYSVPAPTDPMAMSLKILVDNAIIDFDTGAKFQAPKMKFSTQQFPVVPNRFLQNFDIITQAGAFYYMIPPLFAFLFIQNQIVRQKQYKLRQGLNVFGASHFSYWLSWFLVSLVYSLLTALSTIASGYAFSFSFYTDTPFSILLIFLFSFCMAMQMLSYFIATLVPNLKTANSISYGFVLFAIVVESFLSDSQLLALIFEADPSGLVIFLKYFLALYPPFSYTKIFSMITKFSGYHFDIVTNKWEKGPGYSWEEFGKVQDGKTITKGDYSEYSAAASVGMLLIDVLFYILLTWYFDTVLEKNRGRSESPIFFVKSQYWCPNRKRKTKNMPSIDDLRNPIYNVHGEQQSVANQRARVNRNYSNKSPVAGMRIKNLSKTFQSSCTNKNRLQALKNISLQIQSNELMSVLGHNGAGKTTLINILTGVLNPDSSPVLDIVINNANINNINEVRRHIGVCPQFDILWKEMTAEEHLRLFARLKGVKNSELDGRIDEILKFVSLLSEKKARVSSFSGGMKRRLSLAVAAVGNPKIIFLDEPTTGLDPKVRQQVWTLIQKLKRHRSVILTTHSMQQADILSDRISILVKGRLKCIGTSIYLKDSYGSGYRVALNVQENKSAEVMKYIKRLFPEAVEVDSNGGNLLVGIQKYENLIAFVRMLENKESGGLDQYTLKQNIKDWNVSHTTLEEVFMKVTKEEEEPNIQ